MTKCEYCKETEKTKTLGISGKWEKKWTYCKEHYIEAKVARDNFLVKNKHPVYDRITPKSEFLKEFLAKGSA